MKTESEDGVKLLLSGAHGEYGTMQAPCGWPDMWFNEPDGVWYEVGESAAR